MKRNDPKNFAAWAIVLAIVVGQFGLWVYLFNWGAALVVYACLFGFFGFAAFLTWLVRYFSDKYFWSDRND